MYFSPQSRCQLGYCCYGYCCHGYRCYGRDHLVDLLSLVGVTFYSLCPHFVGGTKGFINKKRDINSYVSTLCNIGTHDKRISSIGYLTNLINLHFLFQHHRVVHFYILSRNQTSDFGHQTKLQITIHHTKHSENIQLACDVKTPGHLSTNPRHEPWREY